MRRFFRVAVLGLLLSPSEVTAEPEEKNVFAGLPHGYSQQELDSFAEHNRPPLTPRYQGILETRYGDVEPYLVEMTLCTKEGEAFSAIFSFAATGKQMDAHFQDNQTAFYRNLDKQAGNLDLYLREHFGSEDAQSPETLRRLLDNAEPRLSSGGFDPLVAGSVRRLPGGCFMS